MHRKLNRNVGKTTIKKYNLCISKELVSDILLCLQDIERIYDVNENVGAFIFSGRYD